MAQNAIEVPYNRDLKPLEDLLARVQQPGDFCVQGALEAPMPRVEIRGVGALSFPVPKGQVAELIQAATRAPYGRGEETILDESIRKVWQIPSEQVSIGGKSWETTFRQLLDPVVAGLGCGETKVTANLYKLLIYEEGGFFKVHRDTEKETGMFGTLVVVLPAAHTGGELVVRHAGHEARLDLASDEFAELRFAAFYADCQHEVLSIRSGQRICLVYNLCQTGITPKQPALTAPLYDSEAMDVALLLNEVFAGPAPVKLAWLLEHEYSPAGLALGALKGSDSARARLLARAADEAGCAFHLGIVHIQESGWAEHAYVPYSRGRSRSRWHRDEDEADASEENADEFSVGEVCDGFRAIDHWRDAEDRPVEYGPLPLEDDELLPAGALDGERPDEQRFTEATGNEGASFERAYHRAVLVVWPREKFARVLLQASIGSALVHLRAAAAKTPLSSADRQAILGDLRAVIKNWEAAPSDPSLARIGREASRAEMLELLNRLRDTTLLERFIAKVVTPRFDGSESPVLAKGLILLGPTKAAQLLAALARAHVQQRPNACIRFLNELLRELGERRETKWNKALGQGAAEIVEGLPKLKDAVRNTVRFDWQWAEKSEVIEAASAAALFESLRAIQAQTLRAKAAATMANDPQTFDPVQVVVPALQLLHRGRSLPVTNDPDTLPLWRAATEFLLWRSEHPPTSPTDWRQEVSLACRCAECRELTAFANNPAEQTHRFCARQDLRIHLESQIRQNKLDLTCVTDRKGRPQTLVCTKTHGAYQRRCAQHTEDCAAMRTLFELLPTPPPKDLSAPAARLAEAANRKTSEG